MAMPLYTTVRSLSGESRAASVSVVVSDYLVAEEVDRFPTSYRIAIFGASEFQAGFARGGRKRVLPPDEFNREEIRDVLGDRYVLTSGPPAFGDVTLVGYLMLRAVMKASKFNGSSFDLAPYNASSRCLQPRSDFSQSFFQLTSCNLLGVDDTRTPRQAVEVEKDGQCSFYLDHVAWRLHPEAPAWIERVQRGIDEGRWPLRWAEALPEVALKLARSEVAQYVRALTELRDLPMPEDTEKLDSLIARMLQQVSVGEAFSFFCTGARAAADFLLTRRPSRAAVATRLVNATAARFTRWSEAPYQLTNYDRIKQAARSWVSFVLYEEMLHWDDRGFTSRLRDLPFPAG